MGVAAVVKLLLDTHVFLWASFSEKKLNRRAARAVNDLRNEVWLSPISILELANLTRSDRVQLDPSFDGWVSEAISRLGYKEAPVTFEVARETRGISLPHHDPADRILAASARVFGLTLVTADEALLSARGVPTMRAG